MAQEQEQGKVGAKAAATDTVAGKYLTFQLAEEQYGLKVLRAREIVGMMEVTEVPCPPDYVPGVINLRGRVIPVVNLRLRFGMPYREPDERTCVVVTEVNSGREALQMGIMVDRVNEVVEVREDEIEPAPNFGTALDTSYILGMAKVNGGVKILLDIDKVLTGGEVAAPGGF